MQQSSTNGAHDSVAAVDCAGVGSTSAYPREEITREETQSPLGNIWQGQSTRTEATAHAAQNGATASSSAQEGPSDSRSTGTSGAEYWRSSAGSQRPEPAEAQWAQQVFRAFDTDGRGLLDTTQLSLALSSIGIRLPLDLLRAAMRAHAATAATAPASVQGGEYVDMVGFQVLAWRLARVGDLTASAGAGAGPTPHSTPPMLPLPTPLPAASLLPLPLPLGQEEGSGRE
jgi:hypothetical protein